MQEKVRQIPLQAVAETTGVPIASIHRAAWIYADAKPATLGWGNPLEHTLNAFDTARSLICLMAVCGNLERPGGNIQAEEPPITKLGRFVRADLLPRKPKTMVHAYLGTIPRLMTLPPAHFKRAVLDKTPYPIRGPICNVRIRS